MNPTPEKYQRITMTSAVPAEFLWDCRFEFAQWLAEKVVGGKRQVELARRAYESMADPDGSPRVVLIGAAGVGKSVLATCIFRELVNSLPYHQVGECCDDGKPAHSLWLDAGELGQEAARSRKPLELLRQAHRAPILVLDDLGTEAIYGTSAIATTISLIRARHNRSFRSIYTTGLDRTELASLYGAGGERRIFDRAAIVAWKGM